MYPPALRCLKAVGKNQPRESVQQFLRAGCERQFSTPGYVHSASEMFALKSGMRVCKIRCKNSVLILITMFYHAFC